MAPSLVQSKSGSATSGTTVTVTLTTPTTATNCLVVKVGTVQGTTNPTVSGVTLGGSAGNFASAKSLNVGTGYNAEIWTDQNCAGSQTSVVVTFTAGSGIGQTMDVLVEEWSGVATVSAVDKTNGGDSLTTTSSFSSGSTGTLAQANEVAVAACAGSSPSGPASPWTNLTAVGVLLGGYQVVSATTALTYSGTTSTTAWTSVIVTLRGITSVTGTGSFALGPLRFGGANYFNGTGTFKLGPLAFGGTNLAVAPTVPVEPAGVIATSADHNAWAEASAFLAQSTSGARPIFYLMAAATQALTTTAAAVNFSNTAAIFKDNNGGWSSGNPSQYTVKLAGYYHIEWSVSAASGATRLECYALVTTTAANPYNPSTTFQFQHNNRTATTNVTVTSSGGLVPIYLAPGDIIQVFAVVGTAENTSASFFPQLSGEWVSS